MIEQMTFRLSIALALLAISGCTRYVGGGRDSADAGGLVDGRDDRATPPGDVGVGEHQAPDVHPSDAPTVDMPPPDGPTVDMLSADVARPDVARPDVLKPDVLKPDVLSPDLPSPDLPSPDLPSPDLPSPDLPSPDLTVCDHTPAPFSLDDFAHQAPGALVIYDADGGIRVQGVTCPTVATVSGTGTPQLDINKSGAWATSGTVVNGDYVRVRMSAATTPGGTRTASLSIGTRTAPWTLTTCSGPTCMTGSLGSNVGCSAPNTRVWRWQCPGSTEWIYAQDFTYQTAGTGLLSCPVNAICEWQNCGGNGWDLGTLSCP